jgi:hypothetical protein
VQATAQGEAVRLLVRDGELFFSASPAWRGGQRFPRLQRLDGVPDRLAAIYAPR